MEISVQCGPETGTVRIVDRNPAIPEMEREVLRGDSEIGPLFHGSGLGLWLVNHIVRDADGFLQFEENEPHGNIVAMHLPSATDQ